MKLKAPETVFSSAGFCPGCGHGLATRLIGEVSEELGIQETVSYTHLTLPTRSAV